MAFESKSVEDLGEWLVAKGFSHEVAESFEDQGMDGEAIAAVFATNPGPDCLREVLPKLGTRLKVYNALRKELMSEIKSPSPSPANLERTPSSAGFSLVGMRSRAGSDVGLLSPKSPTDCDSPMPPSTSASDVTRSTNTSKSGKVQRKNVPDPFPIPKFRLTTEKCLEKNVLTDKDRKYIVRTLSTILMTYVQKPTINDCDIAAISLVARWSFLADGEGGGQHSWKWFIYNRCQNTNRSSSMADPEDAVPSRKRAKVDKANKHPYPPIPAAADDDISNQRNLDLLNAEIRKPKPRPEVLKDLMYHTFSHRREAILEDSFPSATDIMVDYPLLKKSSFIAHEFGLVTQKTNIRDQFEESFLEWSKAIIKYCKESQVNNSALQAMLLNDEDPAMVALRCLGVLFSPLRKKPTGSDIPFLLKVVPHGTPTSEAIDSASKQPYIVLFAAEEDDLNNQFFLVVEREFILECGNPTTAVFNLMAAHYVFNLDYDPKAKDALTFIQEKVLEIVETGKKPKSATVAAHTAGILRYYED